MGARLAPVPRAEEAEAGEQSTSDAGALEEIAEHLEETGWASALVDSDWRIVWVSSQLRQFMGGADDGALGLGRHFCEILGTEAWRNSITAETRMRWLHDVGPFVAHDTRGGVEGLRELVAEDERDLLEGVEAATPPAVWGWTIEFLQDDLPAASARCLAIRHERAGELLGTTLLYGADLPATLLALLARGDPGMFSRMARLVEPARRSAAILFVDVCSSGALSRQLPTARYFRLIQAVMTAVDEVLARRHGVIGKHVGDGATGFFLSEDLGSDSATARAAIEAAREVTRAAQEAAGSLAEGGTPLAPVDVGLRIGLHWGWSLYMGQVVRGGRLEVSALGDEVNECARIEQSAAEGTILASKALVERLDPASASELGIHPDVRYRALGELPGAEAKAQRDAGGIAVVDLPLEGGARGASNAGGGDEGGWRVIKRVVVGTEGSDRAARAVGFGLEVSQRFDARLVPVSARVAESERRGLRERNRQGGQAWLTTR